MRLYFSFIVCLLLYIFSSAGFAQHKAELILDGANVNQIVEFENSLWVSAYGKGVFEFSFKENKWTNYAPPDPFIYNVAVSKDYIWAGGNTGLYIYNRKTGSWSTRKFAQGDFGNWVRALYYDKKQNILWIGRLINVTRLDVAKQRYSDIVREINGDNKANNIISIKADGDSLIWFGSESGLHKYNNKKAFTDSSAWTYFTNKKGFFMDEGEAVSVADIFPENNNLWLATDEFVTAERPKFNTGGLFKWNRAVKWERFGKRNGFSGDGINCIEKTGNYIWAALYSFSKKDKKEYGRGIVLLNRYNGEIKQVDLGDININTPNVNCMFFNGKNLYMGTDIGLFSLKIDNEFAKFDKSKNEKK